MENVVVDGSGWRAGPLATHRVPGEQFKGLVLRQQRHDFRALPEKAGDARKWEAYKDREASLGNDFRLKTYRRPSTAHDAFEMRNREQAARRAGQLRQHDAAHKFQTPR